VKEKDISDFIVAELKIHPSTLIIQYMEDIPLTSNGKIDYTKIYEQHRVG